MRYPKRSQYKYAKSRYRVKNWAQYEAGLQIPGHTTRSSRLEKLDNLRFRRLVPDDPIHLLIDSAGWRIHVGHLRGLLWGKTTDIG